MVFGTRIYVVYLIGIGDKLFPLHVQKGADNIQDAVLFLIKTIVLFAIIDPVPVTKKPPRCLSSPLCRKGCRYGFEGPDANGCFEACPPCSEIGRASCRERV